MRFEPTTTEFCSDALTDWDIRPWVQLAPITKFVRLLQFHLFVQCSHFILAIVFASCYICFKRYLSQIITLVAEWIDTYSIPHWKIFEVAIESWSEWDFNPQPLNSVQIKYCTITLVSIYFYFMIWQSMKANEKTTFVKTGCWNRFLKNYIRSLMTFQ